MKFAICQELFEGWDWERQCRFAADLGYTGLEVAPFTLAPRIEQLAPDRRRELRRIAADNGVEIIGLHWLLAKTEGFHLTTRDAAVRARTADYLVELGRACADLGGSLMVLGSPLQRNLEGGMTEAEGMDHAAGVLARVMPELESLGVRLCLEPLSPKETNFLNTCASAVAVIERVGSSHLVLHQDVKAMLSEPTPIPELIHRFKDVTGHFHVNDGNLLGPGMGETDFHPILRALRETGYNGWVSVEVFDYRPGCETIARESIEYMRRVLDDLARPSA